MAEHYDDPRFRWLLTDGWAGRIATPVLLLEDTAKRCARVRLLADFRVARRTYPAGTEKRVPQKSLTANMATVATRVPIAALARATESPRA